jgi:hypothetical protein
VSLDFATKKTVGWENWVWGLSIIGIFGIIGTIVIAIFGIVTIIIAYSNPVSSPLQLVDLISFKISYTIYFLFMQIKNKGKVDARLNGITLGQTITDPDNQMITITKFI